MLEIVEYDESHLPWARDLLFKSWGSTKVVTRGKIYDACSLSGSAALLDGKEAGLLTYRIAGEELEVVTLDAILEKRGVGTGLIDAVKDLARKRGVKRIWLITTNDNIDALRFYQKRGFVLKAVYPNALELSRKLKPSIPAIGLYGIPLRDEIELEMIL